MTEEIDNDNLIDFTEYKLRNLVESLAAVGQSELADALQDALDQYMLGNIDIVWQHGWPFMTLAEELDT